MTISYVRGRFAKEAWTAEKVPDRLIYELLPGPSLTERPDLPPNSLHPSLPPIQARQPETFWNGSDDTETMCAGPGAHFFLFSFFTTHHQARFPRSVCPDLAVACLELGFLPGISICSVSLPLIYPDHRLKCEGRGAENIMSSSKRCDSFKAASVPHRPPAPPPPSTPQPASTSGRAIYIQASLLQIAEGSAMLIPCFVADRRGSRSKSVDSLHSSPPLTLPNCFSGFSGSNDVQTMLILHQPIGLG